MSRVTYSPSHRQAGTIVRDIQPALRTAPICVKMFHLQYFLVATVIHIQSVRSQMCVCACVCIHTRTHKHTYSSQYREAGRPKQRYQLGLQECHMPKSCQACSSPCVLLVFD